MKQNNQRFIVTGPMRSGTTYMASIMNSQSGFVCLEDDPWSLFHRIKAVRTKEQFDCICAQIEAKFTYLGLPSPSLRNCAGSDEMFKLYCQHLLDIYSSSNLGFKRTMMAMADIQARISEGWKVILMKRDASAILKSWVHRIEPSLECAAFRLRSYLESLNHYDIEHKHDSILVVDYEALRDKPEVVLGKVSTFLNHDISLPSQRYHSFNKGRFLFDRNTSFAQDKDPSCLALAKYRDSLPIAYSDSQIQRYALFAQKRKRLFLEDTWIYLGSPKAAIKAAVGSSFVRRAIKLIRWF